MKQAILAMPIFISTLFCGAATAQTVFIQIEAHPDLATAQERTQVFAEYLSDVKGFQIGSRWYGIALGPYDRQSAQSRLEALKELGMIPADSYLSERDDYARQFYPVGDIGLPTPAISQDESNAGPSTDSPGDSTPQLATKPTESRRQALQTEALMSPDQKLRLQRALRHFGFYQGSLDAVFGGGTRRAMAAWQESKGYEPTNVLTSNQREEIIAEHQADLAALGLRFFRNETAGIEIQLPGAMVVFDRFEPPFAYYRPIDDSGVTAVLISQSGDEITLQALYEVLLRKFEFASPGSKRSSSRFTISGVSEHGRTFVYATLADDAVKGFALAWPERNDALRGTVLEAMRESFTPISGTVLADVLEGDVPEWPVDLIDGLELPEPKTSYSGFYIDETATVLTTDKAVDSCERITLDGIFGAELVGKDESTGLALLKPTEPLVPPDYARIRSGVPLPRSKVAVSGYSFGGKLSAPTLTYGRLVDLQGLNGEKTVKRLALAASPGDAGGPVLDATGSLLGLLLPEDSGSGKHLPSDVRFAVNPSTISGFLENRGHVIETSNRHSGVSAVAMAELAADITVLVNCWVD